MGWGVLRRTSPKEQFETTLRELEDLLEGKTTGENFAALLKEAELAMTQMKSEERRARWLDGLRAALEAGIARVQLRAPMLSVADPARWSSLIERAVAIANDTEADVLVNGDIALAERLGIGVHLRAAQLAGLSARPAVAGSVIASCHTLDELVQAQALGCDAVVLGPVLPTASHPGQAGGLRDADALGEGLVGDPAIGGEDPQNRPIEGVESNILPRHRPVRSGRRRFSRHIPEPTE